MKHDYEYKLSISGAPLAPKPKPESELVPDNTRYLILSMIGVILLIIATLIGLMTIAKADTINYQKVDRPIEPSDTVQNIWSNAVLTWFVEQWREAGYDMPKDGEAFKWSDYLSAVPDKVGEKGDLVRYMSDEGKAMVAIVLAPAHEGGKADDTKLAVKYPIGPGMSMMMGVEEKDVVGYLRPHKAAHKDGEI